MTTVDMFSFHFIFFFCKRKRIQNISLQFFFFLIIRGLWFSIFEFKLLYIFFVFFLLLIFELFLIPILFCLLSFIVSTTSWFGYNLTGIKQFIFPFFFFFLFCSHADCEINWYVSFLTCISLDLFIVLLLFMPFFLSSSFTNNNHVIFYVNLCLLTNIIIFDIIILLTRERTSQHMPEDILLIGK